MVELLQEVTRPELNRGLEGVVVDRSELSDIDGDAGRLIYRGYEIEDLATGASFEEVLHLLWHGELPDRDELEAFVEPMAQERQVDDGVLELVAELAHQDEDPMAALRTGVSMLSAYDPEPDAEPEDSAAMARDGRRITAKIPTVLAAFDRYRRGEKPIEPRTDLGHAENFLYMLTGEKPDEIAAETFDMALTLHADHGLNASTFTTLVIVSTYADVYNAITGGIGALAGHWHGGANQDVMYTLMDVDESGLDPIEWVEETLDEGGRVPGWGHRVYNVKDPRAKILEERSALLAESTGETKWHDYTTSIERYLTEEIGLPEKNIAPNVDFYSGSVYYQLGIPIDLYTPIFAMSRVGGWMAHILEYVEDNRLIRPRARYDGPTSQEFVPLEER
ncbi:citrate synthase [Halalkaliarchaeum sp. AArc-GB]|uniref:citrate synthase n=1 Tax=Halalkaliarchaeum sp. AArc-GB TaxID=3074078 RepID=UPI00285BFBE2|nr:citrate synthase [Halalkaliarchaeum sp. AArc-GB]MDR5673282.1 citrate synthase [Halalkaliarchaeum sp. AArc-GB]